MNVDEIADMLIALISNDPVQRVEGLNATAQFLHDLQTPQLRWFVYAGSGRPVFKKMLAPSSSNIYSDARIIDSNEIDHYEVVPVRKLQYLGLDGEWYDIPDHDITIQHSHLLPEATCTQEQPT